MSDKQEAPATYSHPGVTREEAVAFLEIAIRNWSGVQELSEDDIGDMATALLWFLNKRAAPPANPRMRGLSEDQK